MRNSFKQNSLVGLMKNMLGIFGIIGIVILIFANIGGIGYFLYLWGGIGTPFALAAWTAFKVWITGIIIGFALFLIALFSR